MDLVSEFRRRNVFRMAALYVVAAWLVMQVAEVLVGLANLPEWIGPTILVLLAIGFPIALVLSWFYELTPTGISREGETDAAELIARASGRRVDFIVIALLAAGLLLFAYDKWWVGPPPVPLAAPEKSIAVLPFVNMSADPDQEYFSEGISEELLNLLAQIPELRVISRSSAFSFKDKEIAIPEVARQLNVAHILEGSVRKDGGRVRITAQLIEARSDTHLWSETYDRTLDDIFAVQDEIAAAIAAALEMKLAIGDGEVVPHLERALRLDGNFAPAHAQLGTALIFYIGFTPVDRHTAIEHLDRALALEPYLAEAHAGRALLALHDQDFESAAGHSRKALASNPNYVDAMRWLASALNGLGRDEEAEAIREQVLVVDPLSVISRVGLAQRLVAQGQTEEAHAIADQLLAEKKLWAGHRVHVDTYLAKGKLAEGLYWALQGPGHDYHIMNVFFLIGEYAEARRTVDAYSFLTDAHEGRWDSAIQAVLNNLELYPDNQTMIGDAADVLYFAGRFDEALPIYERLLDMALEGRPIPGWNPLGQTMALALARRKAGDESSAEQAASIVRQHLGESRAAGARTQMLDLAEALLAAFEYNRPHAITALRSAIQSGLRSNVLFNDPMFEYLQDDPGYVVVRQEFDAMLAAERAKVLQLICFNNPAPDNWQPLPETCQGVVEMPAH